MGQAYGDKPAASKNAFGPDKVAAMADLMGERIPAFDREAFDAAVYPGLTDLEMKARTERIARAIAAALPLPYPEAVAALLEAVGPPGAPSGKEDVWGPDAPSNTGLSGFTVWPLTRFVALYGAAHFDASMTALQELTRRWTAEFALRSFLETEPARTLGVLEEWTRSPDQHLRRAASESTRPRLPWGMRLQGFVADPAPVLALIEPLRADPEEYVRRSVANNLNDIGKDHPDVLVEVAERWWAEGHPSTRKLVRHALRSLVKAGHPGALRILGFTVPARVEVRGLDVANRDFVLGGTQIVTSTLVSTSDKPQRLVVDYVLHLVGSRRKRREKVFKGKSLTLAPLESVELTHKMALRPVTTRRYYPGTHGIELVVCGERIGQVAFELTVP